MKFEVGVMVVSQTLRISILIQMSRPHACSTGSSSEIVTHQFSPLDWCPETMPRSTSVDHGDYAHHLPSVDRSGIREAGGSMP